MNSDFEKWKEREGFSDIMEGYTASFEDCWNAARAAGMETVYEKVEEIGLDNCSCVDGEKCESCYTVDEILEAIRPTTQDNKEG